MISRTRLPPHSLLPRMSVRTALSLQHLARTAPVLRAEVTGFSTPAISDVGAASICLRFEASEGTPTIESAPPQPLVYHSVWPPPAPDPARTPADAPDSAAKAPMLSTSASSQQYRMEGGYVLALQPAGSTGFWLPCIAGVPGSQGRDRMGLSREGLAECVVMARPLDSEKISSDSLSPLEASDPSPRSCSSADSDVNTQTQAGESWTHPCALEPEVTSLQEQVLRDLMPSGTMLRVALVHRSTDFFLGMNANRWLCIRMSQLTAAAEDLASCTDFYHDEALRRLVALDAESAWLHKLFKGCPGVGFSSEVEPPPGNASYLFDHNGAGGNAGVSGQVIWR